MTLSKETKDWIRTRFPDAKFNENGEILIDQQGVKVDAGTVVSDTFQIDLAKLFQASPNRRVTKNYEIFRIEAELASKQGELDNPAHPPDDETERRIRARLQRDGLEPAWEASNERV